ncbi:MAG: hypothetical protein HN846_05130 [Candidatus Pacebacteria bacterium]|mgnify:CR=1 FL=1|jgi:hypothetical protein|nr:hypothetical protein [Candidatus Paceibacterota bacterium]MBT3512054.1 hypothetical protein [Candidatus Paceibacterota bacterium]MBT4004484.1 hypothetical protein [Candidatus Paceibacterota bacterium]MBT4359085.1 hypothetical protein [Candidatus Paceibacterota bacterium]MBT4681380.1 hypothetical protein [Candidatus Paceibacterota bacterium]
MYEILSISVLFIETKPKRNLDTMDVGELEALREESVESIAEIEPLKDQHPEIWKKVEADEFIGNLPTGEQNVFQLLSRLSTYRDQVELLDLYIEQAKLRES